ncbi:MAG: hypothetical protein AB1633_09180, partial [Elusimicrobiota bacterium]
MDLGEMSKGICIQFGVILMAGIFFVTLWPFSLYADVIPAPYLGEDVGIALEFIASREKNIRNDFSYVTWGGFGWITSLTGEGGIYYGFELALEGRAYRDGRQLKGAFGGAYVGSALIRIRSALSYPNADYLGFTLGSKIGYKFVSSLAPLGWKKVRILSEP